ncbi:hypothetical protein SUGI_0297520 [Cryptomeria japonica]|nr:hypothetical protein SUGI_0297520 [Cryptomeria japonica]
MRFRGVRKRKWGKYVAEIRSGKRSRISLGSYFTPHAAARAYDTALLRLRGPTATSFNFPDSRFNSTTALEVANAQGNLSADDIRAAAIAVGSAFDTIPEGHGEELAGPSTVVGTSIQEETAVEASIQFREALNDETHQVTEQEENDATYLLQTPEHISFEESVQMAPLQPDSHVLMQSYDQSELFLNLAAWDTPPKQHP